MRRLLHDHRPLDDGYLWRSWFSTNAFAVDKGLRRVFRLLPADPRCKFCNAPFRGVGGVIVRTLYGKQQSGLNPGFCNICEQAAHRFPGGAEVPMSMLFADIRGSTALSEEMSPTDFSQLINRFYTAATRLIASEDGLIEKLAGDSIAAFWGEGVAGPRYIQRTISVAGKVRSAMAEQHIPVGIGVHAGIAYYGVVGRPDGPFDITFLGDEVNTAARLASQAAEGEIVVSEQALRQAGIDASGLEARNLDLKGITAPVAVRVMRG